MARSLCQSRIILLSAVVCVLLVKCQGQGIPSSVNTTSGEVTGKAVTFRGKNLLEFKMVPYAEPPTGELRFKPSLAKSRETSEIDGTKDDYIMCPQTTDFPTHIGQLLLGLVKDNFTLSEDCLYLDVYVPQAASPANLLPVFFWIHGGGYTTGGGRLSSGRVLASDFDIVVVAINYRLGALGFINTGDETVVADLGLRDQILALQWVNDNIAQFGGDREKITIGGESAGGGSVAQLTVSPLTEGLFRRAIIQSGGLDNPWACLPNPQQTTTALARTMNCNFMDNKELVNCLKSNRWEDIVKYQGITWAPACSGGVIPFTQQQLDTAQINSDVAKRLAQLDILMGVNSQEGALLFDLFSDNQTTPEGGIKEALEENIILSQLDMRGLDSNIKTRILPAIKFQYTDWVMPNSPLARSKKVVDFLSDYFFIGPAMKYIGLHNRINVPSAESGQSYLYLLKHRPSWMSQAPWRYGADHGDDLFFMFGNPLEYPSLAATAEEEALSQVVMTYWTNFIKTGNPNTPVTTVNTNPIAPWPEFEPQNQTYIQLDTTMDGSSTGQRMFAKRVAFWTDQIPSEIDRLQALTPPPPCEKDPSGSSAIQAAVFTTTLPALVIFWLHSRYWIHR